MKNKIVQYSLNTCYSILSIATFYYMCCLVLPLIHVNGDYLYKNKGVLIFVAGDGLHSEIIIPAKNEITNWESYFNVNDYDSSANSKKWICLGFSEENFYKTNRRWDDMNYLSAFTQLCGFGKSIIHVSYENEYPFNKNFIRKIYIGTEQYANLCEYIKSSFVQNNGENILPLAKSNGLNKDVIYEAQKEFSFLYTCNTWTNSALKSIGFKTGRWTALESGIREQF
ncbi:MAG: DUF2459 domain-containing protein [Bacteroidia bacterium]|nr:DUF2459 domain-containing protein [Bacteroidia bacterium]